MSVQYTDQMFNWATASTTLTQMYAGTSSTAGPYYPQLDGTLLRIDVLLNGQAATSLCQQARVELSQTNWVPNILRFPLSGYGLLTAPQLYGGDQGVYTFLINQPIKTNWPITGNFIAYFSPVTPAVVVTGYFST